MFVVEVIWYVWFVVFKLEFRRFRRCTWEVLGREIGVMLIR